MANTFMIEVRFNGRPVYANVYLHTKGQLTYHVNFIGDSLPEFLKDPIVMMYEGEELKAVEDGLPWAVVKKIVDAIERHFG